MKYYKLRTFKIKSLGKMSIIQMCASLFTCVERGMLRKTEAAIFPPQPGKKLTETTVADVVGLSHLIQ